MSALPAAGGHCSSTSRTPRSTRFPQARKLGYDGVSSKSCKGLYKSLLNAARCARWNASEGQRRYFVSGEDLTMQAGLGVQQDLALVSLLELPDVERNGHHYVDGFGGGGADDREQENFLAACPSLYERSHGGVRLAIRGGMIDLASLAGPGFASLAAPDFAMLDPLGALHERTQSGASGSGESRMNPVRLGIIMNGVTGRMGTNQHLVRSICAIRAQGGVALAMGAA